MADMVCGESSFPQGNDFYQPVAEQKIPANGPVRFFHNQMLVVSVNCTKLFTLFQGLAVSMPAARWDHVTSDRLRRVLRQLNVK
jgi:hypothetical protein